MSSPDVVVGEYQGGWVGDLSIKGDAYRIR